MGTRSKLAVALFSGVCLLAPVAPASAALITQTDSVAVSPTNWSDMLSFSLFDSSLGTLNSITFKLSGLIMGTMAVENMDPGPATITSAHLATLTLTRPDLSTIVLTMPSAGTSASLSGFDGIIDFAGTSGTVKSTILSGSVSSIMSPPPASDLTLFTGIGTISLPISVMAMSTAMGSGNMMTWTSTKAGASLDLTYDYTPTPQNVPEPGTLTLLGTGLLGLGAMGRRRKAKAAK